jgi:hypothetical protein
MPSEKLTTGWMEQGLLRKGFTGKLQDKRNQETLVIPSDRFARLARDLEKDADTFVGLLILGKRGLKQPKFCTLVYKSSEEVSESFVSVSFWTRNLGTKDIATTIARHLLSQNCLEKEREIDLDYVERLAADAASGMVRNLLSLCVKQDKMNIADWIQDSVKNVNESRRVISHYGNIKDLLKAALLFSRWLTSLELFRKSKENLAAIYMMSANQIEACLWDSPQNIATFASLREISLSDAIERYLSPMWASREDLGIEDRKSPEVVIEEQYKAKRPLHKPPHESYDSSTSASLNQIKSRIDALDIKIQHIKSLQKSPIDNLDQSFMIIQTRITDVLDRLETLAKQLEDLELRLKTAGIGK